MSKLLQSIRKGLAELKENKSDEYYTHSGDRIKIEYCDCDHSKLDHDEWGCGECLICGCNVFQGDRS